MAGSGPGLAISEVHVVEEMDGPTCDALLSSSHIHWRTKSNHRSPTVQQKCIPQALLQVDILCQAKSGLGKTAVFVLATLHMLEAVPGEASILVMCHTRELAYQIKNEYARFSKYLPDVKTAVFYGGTPIQKDIELLKNKESFPNIIVGTPGRLNALVRDKYLSLRNVKHFVLDECDKMLDQIGKHCFRPCLWTPPDKPIQTCAATSRKSSGRHRPKSRS